MKSQINREVRRFSLIKNCQHEFVDYAIKDPADKRHKLKPHLSEVFGKKYAVRFCKNCGIGKLFERER